MSKRSTLLNSLSFLGIPSLLLMGQGCIETEVHPIKIAPLASTDECAENGGVIHYRDKDKDGWASREAADHISEPEDRPDQTVEPDEEGHFPSEVERDCADKATGDWICVVDYTVTAYGRDGELQDILVRAGECDEYVTSGVSGDCDDDNASVNPGASEVCHNGIDDDCDLSIDEDDEDAVGRTTLYLDADGDGLGDPDTPQDFCDTPDDGSHVDNADDCDDTDPSVGAAETWYRDADGDGFGDASNPTEACELPTDHVDTGTDCDDLESAVHPDGVETCDGLDNDCDGLVDRIPGELYCLSTADDVIIGESDGGQLGFALTHHGSSLIAGAPEAGYHKGSASSETWENGLFPSAEPELWIDAQATDGLFGYSVLALADEDFATSVDYAVGAPGLDPTETPGAVWLFDRPSGVTTDGAAWVTLTGESAFGQDDGFGRALASWQDQVVIGAPFQTNTNGSGAVYLVDRDDLSEGEHPIAEVPHHLIESTGSDFGSTLVQLGDSLVVGAPDTASKNGAVYVFDFPEDAATSDDADLVLTGAGGEKAGTALAVGDINNDGVLDLVVGAPSADQAVGSVYVLLGAEGLNAGASLESVSVKLSRPDHLAEELSYFGWSVSVADVDDDGRDDILVGAWGQSSADGDTAGAGAAYLYLDPTSGDDPIVFEADEGASSAGWAVVAAPGQVAIGGPDSSDGGTRAGQVWSFDLSAL